MRLDHVPRLMRTMRSLRSSQIWWRARYYVERRLPRTLAARDDIQTGLERRDPKAFPEIPVFHRQGPTGSEAVENLHRGLFTHLHRTVDIGRDDSDWLRGGDVAGRLWSITLHYHGWVYDLAEAAGQGDSRALPLLQHYLDHWLDQCRLKRIGSQNLIWNAFSIATRAAWWIRALRLLDRQDIALPDGFRRRWEASLARQGQFLSQHLEWDLRGNHLLRDAVGLAWLGRYFEGRRAERWLRLASELAESQALEQVLPDGGHFERSPMYHIHVMEDFLSLALLLPEGRVTRRLHDACRRMAEFAAWVRYSDGTLPLFNDAAQHAVCEPDAMLAIVEQHVPPHITAPFSRDPKALRRGALPGKSENAGGLPSSDAELRPNEGRFRHFEQSGIVVWHGDPWTVVWDVGDVGPGYQPGHAHADTLTFECAFRGHRLVVDPGTHSYDADARRRYDRSTAAHNVVCIDGRDSSEVWHIFRVGRRATPRDVQILPQPHGFVGTAAHNGYDHLPGKPRHRRQIAVNELGELRLIDHIDGRGTHRLEGGYLLSPEWTATPLDDHRGFVLRCGEIGVNVGLASQHPLTLSIESRPYHPEYGVELETLRLVWRCAPALPTEVVTTFRSL